MLSRLKEKLEAHITEFLVVVVGTGLLALLLFAEKHLTSYIAQLEPTTVVRAGAALLLVAAWAVALFLFFRPRFKFISRLGIYRDMKTGLCYCPSCHNSKKSWAPMMERKAGWHCVTKGCQMFFPNPEYKAPKRPQPADSGF